MKYFNFILSVFIGLAAQTAFAQKINFKDQNLKQALLDKGYDKNRDGEIEVSEIDTITKLNVEKRHIKSLEDLVWFKSLRLLYANGNEIQNLDVFFDNPVIEAIYIGDNRIGKKLILKNLKNLKRFYAFRDNLEEIDFTGTNNIQLLYLQENRLQTINLSNLPKLANLILFGNKNLKLVDISSNPGLSDVDLEGTAITQLNVANNPLLKILYVDTGVKLIKSQTQSDLKPAPVVNVGEQKN